MHTTDENESGASPQIEDGHIKIANEIGEALARFNLSAYEYRILWVIWRKTYGWHKKRDWISITQFQGATGLKRRHVSRTLSKLIKKNIVTRIGDTRNVSYQFQKDYTKWRDVTQTGEVSPKQVPTKAIYKSKRLVGQKNARPESKGIFRLLGRNFPPGNRATIRL